MPRRAKSKSKEPKKQAGGDKSAPTPEQWNEMKHYTSFIGTQTLLTIASPYDLDRRDFLVHDKEGNENRFSQGQAYVHFHKIDTVSSLITLARATILPFNRKPTEKLELHEYWVGKIREIRAIDFEDEERVNEVRRLLSPSCHLFLFSKVWVRVQWFYSPKDVHNVVKSL